MTYANYIIADSQAYYYNTNTHIGKVSITGRTRLWHIEKACPYTIIMDRQHIYAGGDGEFAVFSNTDGQELWSAPVLGKVCGLAIADGILLVSTDRGIVYAYEANLPSMSHQSGIVTGVDTATVTAKLHDTGGSTCKISLCYGWENGGKDASSWQHVIDLGAYDQPASLQVRLKDLQVNRLYYCSIKAQNESGCVWLGSTCLTTAPLSVQAEPAYIDESPNRVNFRIHRPQWAASCEMQVNYRLTGSALVTDDYHVPTKKLVLPAGFRRCPATAAKTA